MDIISRNSVLNETRSEEAETMFYRRTSASFLLPTVKVHDKKMKAK